MVLGLVAALGLAPISNSAQAATVSAAVGTGTWQGGPQGAAGPYMLNGVFVAGLKKYQGQVFGSTFSYNDYAGDPRGYGPMYLSTPNGGLIGTCYSPLSDVSRTLVDLGLPQVSLNFQCQVQIAGGPVMPLGFSLVGAVTSTTGSPPTHLTQHYTGVVIPYVA